MWRCSGNLAGRGGAVPALLLAACAAFGLVCLQIGRHPRDAALGQQRGRARARAARINPEPAPATQPTSRGARKTASDISGVYVLGLEARSAEALEPYLKNPAIDGFSLRAGWKDVEPTEGTYDWSAFDPVIADAAQHGKKIMLRVLPGVKTPEWVYAAGAVRFAFTDENPYHKTAGDELAMPVPWDPIYLQKWLRFVAAFGAKYAANPAVRIVAITGPAAGGEMHLPAKDSRDRWHAAGYSDATLAEAWKKAIDAFAAAFPRQHRSVAIAKAVSFDEPQDLIERVARACAEAGCGLQGNWLAAKTRAQNPLYRRIAAHAAVCPVGFQTLSGAGSARFGGTLRPAVELALKAHACYLEIYLGDISAYPDDVAYAHEQLSRMGK
jgi:hypothetical protein